jgi:hypothetical protein
MTSTDDYAALLRFRDRIKMETRLLARRSAAGGGAAPPFHLDPAALKPVAGKIGARPTGRGTDEATRTANMTLVKETLAKKAESPHKKYAAPPTAASEVGWHAHRTDISEPFSRAVHKVSDVAHYGDVYAVTMKAGPYDKTQPVGRGN